MPKQPSIPNPLPFEGIGLCFWEGPPVWKRPDRNEFFVSGAIPEGYRAKTTLLSNYWVVRPTHKAKATTTHVRGRAVEFTPGGVPIPHINKED